MCSGSWDCRIKLWQTNELDKGGDSVSIKKRKMDNEDEESQSQVVSLLRILNFCRVKLLSASKCRSPSVCIIRKGNNLLQSLGGPSNDIDNSMVAYIM